MRRLKKQEEADYLKTVLTQLTNEMRSKYDQESNMQEEMSYHSCKKSDGELQEEEAMVQMKETQLEEWRLRSSIPQSSIASSSASFMASPKAFEKAAAARKLSEAGPVSRSLATTESKPVTEAKDRAEHENNLLLRDQVEKFKQTQKEVLKDIQAFHPDLSLPLKPQDDLEKPLKNEETLKHFRPILDFTVKPQQTEIATMPYLEFKGKILKINHFEKSLLIFFRR